MRQVNNLFDVQQVLKDLQDQMKKQAYNTQQLLGSVQQQQQIISSGGWSTLFPNIVSPLNQNWAVLNTGNAFSQNYNTAQQVINIWQNGTTTNFLICCLLKTLSPPYTVDLGFCTNFGFVTGTINGGGGGLIIRNSANDHVVIHAISAEPASSSNARISGWNSTTTGAFGTDYLGTSSSYFGTQIIFQRIKDDGVNRTFYISYDNVIYNQVLQQASGTFITPNQIGIHLIAGNLGVPIGLLLFHYREH